MNWRTLSTLIAATLALGTIGISATRSAFQWIGQPFPGFLVLENRVVASAGLPDWEATRGGAIFQSEVVRTGGEELPSAAALQERIAATPVDTPVSYRFRDAALREYDRAVPVRRFGGRDFLRLFGLYLLNGAALGLAAVLALGRAGRDSGARAAAPFLFLGSLWGLSAMDLYGPYLFFRIHALCESLLFAAAIQMAVGFPTVSLFGERARWIVGGAYGTALGLAVFYQWALFDPSGYVLAHLVATSLGGLALLGLLVTLVVRFGWFSSGAQRRRLGIVLAGAAIALVLPIALTLPELATGGSRPQNWVGATVFILPAALGYAIWREDVRLVRDARAI